MVVFCRIILQGKIIFVDSDNTLVHKNIASRKHNICYEAKLLSIFGQSKAKPRKVLCYIGPKQVIFTSNLLGATMTN